MRSKDMEFISLYVEKWVFIDFRIEVITHHIYEDMINIRQKNNNNNSP